jgi:hypothetical protein
MSKKVDNNHSLHTENSSTRGAIDKLSSLRGMFDYVQAVI